MIYYLTVFLCSFATSGVLFAIGTQVFCKSQRKKFPHVFGKMRPFILSSGVALGLLYLFLK